jgi:hypothetical protein
MVTTGEARSLLKARGIAAPYQTLVRWVRGGLFPGAQLDETPRGPVWMIPAEAVARFEPPKKGRPVKPEPSAARTSKRSRKAGN